MSLPLWIQFPWLNPGRVQLHQRLSYHRGHPIPVMPSMEAAGRLIAPMSYATERGLDWWGHPSFVQFNLDLYGIKGSRGDCDTTAMWLAAVALKCAEVDAVRIGAAFWMGNDGKQHGHAVCCYRVPGEGWNWQSPWKGCAPVRGQWLMGMRTNWEPFGRLLKAVSWRATLADQDTIKLDSPEESVV